MEVPMSGNRLILLALLVSLAGGCAQLAIKSPFQGDISRKQSLLAMDPEHIQVDTMGFADRFVTTMTSVYDQIERAAPSTAAKDAAHQLKTDLALGAISAAVNPRPIAGMIDMLVLVTLLRQISEEPWTAQMFGAETPLLIQSLRRQEADIRSLAQRYLDDSQLAELSRLTEEWRQAHPGERAVSRVHLADLPQANLPPAEAARMPKSIFGLLFFDPTANLDPAVREITLSRATSERMFFYLQRLPLLLQLQVESFYRLLLEAPRLKQALTDVSSAAQDTTHFVEIAQRFTNVVAGFPQQLSNERQQAMKAASAELTAQRDASIKQLSEAITLQREAAIQQAVTQIAAQRDQTVKVITETVRHEQQGFLADFEAIINRSINKLLGGLAVLSLLVAIVLLLARLASRILARPPLRNLP
jgi:hypothetical protein